MKHFPRFMIAGTSSGSGKTFFTCGILELLKKYFCKIQAFKCGPDYIDPMFHKQVLGLSSVNLDTFFTEDILTNALFTLHAKDANISVIEGVMGFFDGVSGVSTLSSSCHLAYVTKTPVILVVDCSGISLSVAAVVKGFCDYDKNSLIRAIVLNKISQSLFERLKPIIEKECNVKVIGFIPKDLSLTWESRHLGLLLPSEITDFKTQVAKLSSVLEKTIDLNSLIQIANDTENLSTTLPFDIITNKNALKEYSFEKKIKIGIAYDKAFCFYYEDNLLLLEKLGAELVFFSPLKDSFLPSVSGLIFGGGYPELYVAELSANKSFINDLQKKISLAIPILAECGGFMYLQKKLCNMQNEEYSMAEVIDGKCIYQNKLVRFGYASFTGKPFDCSKSITIKGHEFHYFDSSNNGESFIANKPLSKKSWNCMVQTKNILAGFPHLYYYSEPEFALSFMKKCIEFSKKDT